MDIGFNGNTFTWCNRRGGLANIREHLDRVISSVEWRTTFDNAGVVHLIATQSDHVPIVLNLYLDHPHRPRPFRFQEIWIRDPSCEKVIKGAWDNPTNHRNKILIGKKFLTLPNH